MQTPVFFEGNILPWKKLSILFLLLVIVTMLQDLLLTVRNNTSYYWTESFLFNSFWLWFIPVIFFIRRKPFLQMVAKQNSIVLRFSTIIITGLLLHISLYAIMVTTLSFFLFDHTYTLPKVITYTLSNDLYKYLMAYGLLAWIIYKQKATENNIPATPKYAAIKELMLQQGNEHTLVSTAEIILITSASPYIAIHTEKKKYLDTATLRNISLQLDPNVFVRVHKTTIINTNFVASYRSRLNGDYDILLKNQQEIRLSRNYVQAFRQIMSSRSSA